MLKENSKAPEFDLPGNDGKQHTLSDLKGKWAIVYFYPKDDTPGCTREACGFRDSFENLKAKGCVVYGISKDPIESHKKFKDKYDLNFVLLSDAELGMHKAYEVLEGSKTIRSTFLIDASGKIAKVWPNVKVDGHVDDVIKTIDALKK